MQILKLVLQTILILSISSCGSISEQLRVPTVILKDSKIHSPSDWSKPDLWLVTDWTLQELSTAADAEFLDDLEKDVILHLNMARTDPARYAHDFIEPRMEYFSGTVYREPGELTLVTQEGVQAVEECVSDMEDTELMNPLFPSEGISMAALDHALDLSLTGETGHIGSDQSEFSARIERYGQWFTSIGEVISYGPTTGREIVIGLLIDDGVSDRGHRTNVLNPNFRLVGIAIEEHPAYGNVCVIEFAKDYTCSER
ncbi:MAG: CAP domain-containing protein [Candidatus Aegiribacteria sp.]|nr:CAP domain-containing protein [Candidatus Aegiribacteria sp.]